MTFHVPARGARLRRLPRTTTIAAAVLTMAGAGALTAPTAHATSPGTPAAYVANAGDNTVSVLDTTTGTVTSTVPVGGGPQSPAASPDGTRVYVPDIASNRVSVIDTGSDTVTATVPVGTSPTAVAVTPDNRRAYVADLGASAVSVIDTATNAVTATVPVGADPDALTVTPDGSRVYVTSSSGTVSVIDTATNTVSATIATDTGPFALAVTPDGHHVYLANGPANTVSVLDTATNTVTGTIPVRSNPQGVAITPDGSRAYVSDLGSNDLTTIDTATSTVSATTPVGHNPVGLAISLRPLPPPVVTGVSPSSGPPAGGTTVTVSGTNLTDATAITFGPDHPATHVQCTTTTCTAVAPPGQVGTVDVQVTTPAGTSAATAADRFSYTAADVAVSLAAVPQPGLLGGQIAYTVTIADHGPSTLTSASVHVALPAGTRTGATDCTTDATGLTCTATGLAAGTSTARHFSVPVGLLTLDTPYPVTATRTASTPVDLNPANDRASRTCTVLTSLIISCS